VRREIDIVLEAAEHDCAVVDKASHVVWTREELREAGEAGCFPDEDRLGMPDDCNTVSGPYPGCMQQQARPADLDRYRLVGATEHFLIFSAPS
jgi:hypothetical protein